MKKYINNRLYDTDKAFEIDTYENRYYDFDCRYIKETLYQKQNGEFFLFGQGGSWTIYRQPRKRGGFSGSAVIVPLSIEKAKEWAKAHLSAEVYVLIFGFIE